MEIKLHANATTTPRIRRYLQQSDKSDRELAIELGSPLLPSGAGATASQVSDNHTTPKVIHKAMRQEQVVLVNALRDITARRWMNCCFWSMKGWGSPFPARP
jgi:hypothetical protein